MEDARKANKPAKNEENERVKKDKNPKPVQSGSIHHLSVRSVDKNPELSACVLLVIYI